MATVSIVEQRSRAAVKSIYLGGQTVLAVVLGGLRMVLDASDRGIVPHLLLDGYWESWVTTWIANNLREGEVAINIGANCGYYSVMMAQQVGTTGQVVAIEPNAKHVANIRHSMHLNGFHERTQILQAVASDSMGTRKFLMRQDGMSMNSAVSEEGNCEVAAITADHACPKATFAVIDTEGHEPLVWRGMQKIIQNPGFRAIIEWSPQRYANPAAFYGEIMESGFFCSYVAHDGLEKPAPESMMMDGVERMVVLRRA